MAEIRGLAYPLQSSNGNLLTSSDLACLEDQIISVIETRPRERVMRGDYGFDADIFGTLEPNAINARLYASITSQVKGVSDVEVSGGIAGQSDGLYAVMIKYTVNGIPQPPLNLTLNI
jgi:hypothetical protein